MINKYISPKYNALVGRYNSLSMSFRESFYAAFKGERGRRDLLALTLGFLIILTNYLADGERWFVFGRSEARPHTLMVDQGHLRLAQQVTTKPTEPPPAVPARFTPFFFQPVPINTAEADLLTILPGIGEKTAQKIIRFRQQDGPFRSGTDLEKIPGIGIKRRQQLEKYLSFAP